VCVFVCLCVVTDNMFMSTSAKEFIIIIRIIIIHTNAKKKRNKWSWVPALRCLYNSELLCEEALHVMYKYIYINIRMCVCVCVCVYTCIFAYIYTYTYIPIYRYVYTIQELLCEEALHVYI